MWLLSEEVAFNQKLEGGPGASSPGPPEHARVRPARAPSLEVISRLRPATLLPREFATEPTVASV